MPLRCILTGVKGTPDIRENEEIIRVLAFHPDKADSESRSVRLITSILHTEYPKALSKKQASTITQQSEDDAYYAIKRCCSGYGSIDELRSAYQNYIRLFTHKHVAQREFKLGCYSYGLSVSMKHAIIKTQINKKCSPP